MLRIVPGFQAGLIYAVYTHQLDFRRMKHFSCKLGMHWACLDLGRFLGRRYDNPCRMGAPNSFLNPLWLPDKSRVFPACSGDLNHQGFTILPRRFARTF
jgi:hypothetical protein